MDIYQEGMAPRFRALLEHQERQLRAMLRDPGETGDPAGHEVMDFKDIAMQQSLDAIDEVQTEHASRELQRVLVALARLENHGYGLCQDCGEPVDLQRLAALPDTPLCVACQTRHELGPMPGAGR